MDNINYDIVTSDINNLYTMLFTTGYLTKVTPSDDVTDVELKLTNKEMMSLFQSQVVAYFNDSLTSELPTKFVLSLWDGNTEEASDLLTMLLEQTISYHDYCESYYHAFLAGLLAKLDNYDVKSNKETGKGRADIIIKDFANQRAMIIEAKFTKDEKQIDKLCDDAVKQIADREYGKDINKRVYREVLSLGVVFFEKNAYIKMKVD